MFSSMLRNVRAHVNMCVCGLLHGPAGQMDCVCLRVFSATTLTENNVRTERQDDSGIKVTRYETAAKRTMTLSSQF